MCCIVTRAWNEGYPKVREDFTITENQKKALVGAFSVRDYESSDGPSFQALYLSVLGLNLIPIWLYSAIGSGPVMSQLVHAREYS